MKVLTERQRIILHQVIDAHVDTAQPIGSRYLTERYHVPYSPATVRHEMGALEDIGYLTHPHTSSGRVPTDGGYRYYVDHSLMAETIPDETIFHLADDFIGPSFRERRGSIDVKDCAEGASRIVSILANEAGVVVTETPEVKEEDFIRAGHLFVQGSAFILEKPEFQDIEKVRLLFKAFEEKVRLMQWITQQTSGDGISVSIGKENQPEVLWDCTIVSARYFVDGKKSGSISVLGPRRLRYSRAVPLVKKIARLVGQLLSQTEGDFRE